MINLSLNESEFVTILVALDQAANNAKKQKENCTNYNLIEASKDWDKREKNFKEISNKILKQKGGKI